MSKQELASLALKIIAVYALVLLIGQLPMVVWGLRGGMMELGAEAFGLKLHGATVVPLLILAVIVVLLFGLNRTLAGFLADVDENAGDGSEDGSLKQAMAFAVVGVYLVFSTLPELAATALNLLFAGDMMRASMWTMRWPDLLAEALTVALGVVLFLGGGSVTGFWKRLQAASRPLKED
jgi:hypothetical protein